MSSGDFGRRCTSLGLEWYLGECRYKKFTGVSSRHDLKLIRWDCCEGYGTRTMLSVHHMHNDDVDGSRIIEEHYNPGCGISEAKDELEDITIPMLDVGCSHSL